MFTAPAHSHPACLELMETVLKMSVALRVPAGKRWHTHTGLPKELNKGITCIGLGRVQGGWQGWEVVTARSPRPDGARGGTGSWNPERAAIGRGSPQETWSSWAHCFSPHRSASRHSGRQGPAGQVRNALHRTSQLETSLNNNKLTNLLT